jgi:4-alpha-glucanotransferase
MSDALDRLAQAYGIEPDYIGGTGERRTVSDATKIGLLEALGVPAVDEDEVASSLQSVPATGAGDNQPADARCFVPDWLINGRVWGVTCQLYSLRSARNLGIGDFEDLAILAEQIAGAGADFIGVNPLHALFLADPSRCSPYSPSSRRFLNPLYIAVDRPPQAEAGLDAAQIEALRNAELVDYVEVARLKRDALERAYRAFRSGGQDEAKAFEDFCHARGRALLSFALYEALSDDMVLAGHPAGWHSWPKPYRDCNSDVVRRFVQDNAERVGFHMWLQWIAERQLRSAQQRALAAGMRIGLYLDLAVGVAPDGADTWSDPDAVVADARLGCPPDMFNEGGQDWGLAPLSPKALRSGRLEAFEEVLAALMRNAGAVRIDHAMGLTRLYLIPAEAPASEGAYLRYPFRDMLRVLSDISWQRRTVVIGEDLGTVPPGFREMMYEAEIQGYRVFYFEREHDGRFKHPQAYADRALACISTHDLPTLKGWWKGTDISERERLGITSAESAAHMRGSRAHDRLLLLRLLNDEGLLPAEFQPVLHNNSPGPDELPPAVCVAAHALIAKAPSRLVAVQIEDLAGVGEQANLPGTVDEHPNWRRKLPLDLSDLGNTDLFQATTGALSRERPRPP